MDDDSDDFRGMREIFGGEHLLWIFFHNKTVSVGGYCLQS